MPRRIQDWAEERRLEENIRIVGEEFRPRMTAAAAIGDEEEHIVDQEWSAAVEDDITSLGVLKTRRLVKNAARWDVEIPASSWTDDRYQNARYIPKGRQSKIQREIRTVRRERIRWFFQVVVIPTISLLGLIVALVSLLTRK
jgi:hypothetical protein